MKKIHMKQYIRTLMLAVALAPVFSSCDYLDKEPDDMLTLDAVFDNADYTKQWLAAFAALSHLLLSLLWLKSGVPSLLTTSLKSSLPLNNGLAANINIRARNASHAPEVGRPTFTSS